MVSAMEKVMWDDEAGFFFPRWDLEKPKHSKRTCLTGLLPLITGGVSEERARRVIEGRLLSRDHFQAPWLVPFNSVSELAGERIPFEDLTLWRGHCIWISMNWMAARAAALNGREDVSREITRSTALLVARHGFREFYDPRTGEGGGAGGFSWPGLALDMIDRYGL
jgi:neutral trehalase